MCLPRFRFLFAASLFAFLLSAKSGLAQLSLPAIGTPAVVNFEGTLAGVGVGPWAGAGFEPGTATTGRLDSNAWAMTGWSDGNLAFGGTRTTASTDYTRGTFALAQSTGGVYNFNNANIGSNSLGFQPGGSDFAPGTVTLRAVSNTGSTISSMNVSYALYVRNDQARSNSFNSSFSTDDLAYTNLTSLDYTSPAAADALSFQLNARSTTITGLSIPNGASFYLRWSSNDVSGAGNRDEFALDNISLTAVPEPATILALAVLGLGLGRTIRRSFIDSKDSP